MDFEKYVNHLRSRLGSGSDLAEGLRYMHNSRWLYKRCNEGNINVIMCPFVAVESSFINAPDHVTAGRSYCSRIVCNRFDGTGFVRLLLLNRVY